MAFSTASHEERQVQVDGPQQPAHDRTEDEAHAEHRAQHPEALAALLGGADVGDIGLRDGRVGLQRATHEAHCHQHPQRRGQPRDEEAQRQPGEAEQQHRPAAVAVGQRPQHRRADEVGHAEGEGHHAVPEGLVGLRAGELAHQWRQHRDDQADGDHVDQHGDHDEGHRSGAALRPRRGRGALLVVAQTRHSMR